MALVAGTSGVTTSTGSPVLGRQHSTQGFAGHRYRRAWDLYVGTRMESIRRSQEPNSLGLRV